MTSPRRLLAVLTIALIGLAPGIAGASRGGEATAKLRVAICHVPPGNPANSHLIIVAEAALVAHLAHGDVLLGTGTRVELVARFGKAGSKRDCAPTKEEPSTTTVPTQPQPTTTTTPSIRVYPTTIEPSTVVTSPSTSTVTAPSSESTSSTPATPSIVRVTELPRTSGVGSPPGSPSGILSSLMGLFLGLYLLGAWLFGN